MKFIALPTLLFVLGTSLFSSCSSNQKAPTLTKKSEPIAVVTQEKSEKSAPLVMQFHGCKAHR